MHIFVSEKFNEQFFLLCWNETTVSQSDAQPLIWVPLLQKKELTFNPATEKPPQHDRIPHEADPIAQHNLSAQSPAPEAEITRMSQPGIDAVRHEHMALFALDLDQMIKITTRLDHCHGPGRLSRGNHAEAETEPERVQRDQIGRGRRGKEIHVQHAFEKGERVGDIVRASVLGQEEGGHRCRRGIVHRGDVILEEMEHGECEQEEWRTPERGLPLQGNEYAAERDAGGGTEDEGAQ